MDDFDDLGDFARMVDTETKQEPPQLVCRVCVGIVGPAPDCVGALLQLPGAIVSPSMVATEATRRTHLPFVDAVRFTANPSNRFIAWRLAKDGCDDLSVAHQINQLAMEYVLESKVDVTCELLVAHLSPMVEPYGATAVAHLAKYEKAFQLLRSITARHSCAPSWPHPEGESEHVAGKGLSGFSSMFSRACAMLRALHVVRSASCMPTRVEQREQQRCTFSRVHEAWP